ncbi:MAG: helix-turn-helix domain-containing protein [bacterium]|nr:helix-turn-helix domain-containing protein [bacterium]
MRERGLNMRRLSEVSGISAKHLEAIFSGDENRMPSYPYLKGYLLKLGEILDFNSDEAWEQMKKFSASKSAGKTDELPKNRFSQKTDSKYFIIGAVILILFVYGIFRFYNISGTPVVVVSYPQENMAVVAENSVSLAGHVSNSDELRINGEPVQAQPNGDWGKIFLLQPGINTLEITAKKFLGRETKVIRQIIYQPASPAGRPATSTTPGMVEPGRSF